MYYVEKLRIVVSSMAKTTSVIVVLAAWFLWGWWFIHNHPEWIPYLNDHQ